MPRLTPKLSRDARCRRAHELLAEGCSKAEIARRLGCGRATVDRDLERPIPDVSLTNLQDEDGRPVAGAEVGNVRAKKHGVHSERVLSPLREAHQARLREEYPTINVRRLHFLADRMARIEAARNWLDVQGNVVRDKDGEVFPVVRELERWTTRAEVIVAELEQENAERRPFDALREFSAEGSAEEVSS